MALLKFLYLSPAAMQSLNAIVAGPSLPEYLPAWLCDGLPGRPLRAGTSNPGWLVSSLANFPVNFVGAANWNIPEASIINVGDDVTAIITQPGYRGRIPMNGYNYFPDTEVPNAKDITVGGSYAIDVVAGQFFAGKALALPYTIAPRGRRGYLKFNMQPNPQMGNVPVMRKDKAARTLSGSILVKPSYLEAIEKWYAETNDGELVSCIVPDMEKNDFWVVKFLDYSWERLNPEMSLVQLNFQEVPRVRW